MVLRRLNLSALHRLPGNYTYLCSSQNSHFELPSRIVWKLQELGPAILSAHHGLYGNYKHLCKCQNSHFEHTSRIVWKLHASGPAKTAQAGAEEKKNAKLPRGSDVILKSRCFASGFFEKCRHVPRGWPGFRMKKKYNNKRPTVANPGFTR